MDGRTKDDSGRDEKMASSPRPSCARPASGAQTSEKRMVIRVGGNESRDPLSVETADAVFLDHRLNISGGDLKCLSPGNAPKRE